MPEDAQSLSEMAAGNSVVTTSGRIHLPERNPPENFEANQNGHVQISPEASSTSNPINQHEEENPLAISSSKNDVDETAEKGNKTERNIIISPPVLQYYLHSKYYEDLSGGKINNLNSPASIETEQ